MTQAPEWTDEQLAQAQKDKRRRMGACLVHLREQIGMSQEEAAKALGMTPRGLNQIEMGFKPIGWEKHDKAVKFYQSKGAVIHKEPEDEEVEEGYDLPPEALEVRDAFNAEFQAALDAAAEEDEKPSILATLNDDPNERIKVMQISDKIFEAQKHFKTNAPTPIESLPANSTDAVIQAYDLGYRKGVEFGWNMRKELEG